MGDVGARETNDPEGSERFYGAVFGWDTETFGSGPDEVALWRLRGYTGGEPEQPVPRDVVAVMAPRSGGGSSDDATAHWSVNFWVDDADAVSATAGQLGGAVVISPHEAPGFREAVLADAQGAVFSVSQLTAGT
jgi:predicted enzyme related to lactoylglutathione lyase